MPAFGFAWRPLLALLIGAAVLLLPGLGPWLQGLLAAAVYCAAAVALRAVPHEVWLALGRRT